MECRTKDELEQHLSDIRRLASNPALASEDRGAAVRAERFAGSLLREHDASGHNGSDTRSQHGYSPHRGGSGKLPGALSVNG
jgi:hypothetical protein